MSRIAAKSRWPRAQGVWGNSGDLMTDRSDLTALEQMLHYATQEAQRLRVPTVVVRCLRLAADELAQSDPSAPTSRQTHPSMH
jgi:hypothetical protein